jgi:hypothetical protein
MRIRLLAFLLALPAAAFAPTAARAECPVWERVFPPKVDCSQKLPADLSGAQLKLLETAVADHGERIGNDVGDAWRAEVGTTVRSLPEELRRPEVAEYVQCMDWKEGRVCKADYQARNFCLTERKGRMGMDFAPGAKVHLDVASTQGVTFEGTTQPLPSQAKVTTTGGLVEQDGRLHWRTGYTDGTADIEVPESAGRWTLAFDELKTHVDDDGWKSHVLDYDSGTNPPHRPMLRPDTTLTIEWSCEEK